MLRSARRTQRSTLTRHSHTSKFAPMHTYADRPCTLPRGELLYASLGEPRTEQLEAVVQRLTNGKKARPVSARLTREHGLVGDRWSAWRPSPKRQLTLMDVRVIRWLLTERAERVAHQPALIVDESREALELPGDNLVLDVPTSLVALPPGRRFRLGTAILEMNDMPHTGCKKFEERFGPDALAWVNGDEHTHLRLRGLHATVIEDGEITLGDRLVALT